MDDTSMMDTSSDDVDYDIPLSLRIHFKKQAAQSPERHATGFSTGTNGDTLERKTWNSGASSERLKSPGLPDQDFSEEGLRVRGDPLSEVINMIKSSPVASVKKSSEKQKWVPLKAQETDSVEKVGSSGKGITEGNMQSVGTKRAHSSAEFNSRDERYNQQNSPDFTRKSNRRFTTSVFHRNSSSGSDQPYDRFHEFSFKSVEPSKITSPTKKSFYTGGSSSNSQRDSGVRSSHQSIFKGKEPADSSTSTRIHYYGEHPSPNYSSMHISWDKDGRKQTSSLDSPRLASNPTSPSKQGSLWSRGNSSSAKALEAPSPILIPDTPSPNRPRIFQRKWEQTDQHKYKSDKRSPSVEQKDSVKSSGKDNALLSTLLGEESDATSSGSEKRNIRSKEEKGKTSLSPILSAYAKRMSGRSNDMQTSPTADSDSAMRIMGQRKNVSNETIHSPRKDPVWDFATEKSDSPVKVNRSGSYSGYRTGTLESTTGGSGPSSSSSESRSLREDETSLGSRSKSLFYNWSKSPSPSPVFAQFHRGLSSSNNPSSLPKQLSPSPIRSMRDIKDREQKSPVLMKSVVGKVVPKKPIWKSLGSGENDTGKRGYQGSLSRESDRHSPRDARDSDHGDREKRNKNNSDGSEWKSRAFRISALLGLLSSDEEEDDAVPHRSRKRKVDLDTRDGETAPDAGTKRIKTHSLHRSQKSKKNKHSLNSSVHSKSHLTSSISEADPDQLASCSYSEKSPRYKSNERFRGKKSSGADTVRNSKRGKSKRNIDVSVSPGHLEEAASNRALHILDGRSPRFSPISATSHVTSSSQFSSSPSSLPSSSLQPTSSQSPAGARKKDASGTLGSSDTHGIQITSSTSPIPKNEAISIVDDNSDDDDVVVLNSYSYAASLVDSYSKKRKSRKKNTTSPSDTPSTSRSCGTEGVSHERDSVSPTTLQLFNQLDEDEAFARRLQEEFDAEMAQSVQSANERMPDDRRETSGPHQTSAASSIGPVSLDPPSGVSRVTYSPTRGMSLNFPANSPVRISNMNWNINFQPASSLLGNHGIEDTAPSWRRGRVRNTDRPDTERDWMMRVLGDIDDRYHTPSFLHLSQGEMEIPDLDPVPYRGRRRGRGRHRRRRNVDEHDGNHTREGNDYEALLQLADRLGPAVDKRLTQASIERLPTFSYQRAKDQTPGGGEDENSCPICMEEYEVGVEMRRLPCFHGYHKKCIDMWLKKTPNPLCPICRVEVKVD